MSEAIALQKAGQPQSTALGLYGQAPHQNAAMTTVVPLDRENLNFFASMIRNAGLVPKVNNVTPEVSFSRVMAKIVAGTSYGFDPILSQTAFNCMFDGLSLSAQGLEILFRRSGEYDTRIEHLNDDGCKVKILKRINDEWRAIGEVEFNRAMAQKAGLLSNPMYQKYPQDMFFARVMTRAVKRYNPACLQPTVILGNHFAKESQPNYLPPQPDPQPAASTVPQIPAQTIAEREGEDHADPEYVEGEFVGRVHEEPEVDGEVTEYTDVDVQKEQTASAIDSEESQLVDLVTAAKDLYADLPAAQRKSVDKWLGQRMIKDLNAEELSELLSNFQS